MSNSGGLIGLWLPGSALASPPLPIALSQALQQIEVPTSPTGLAPPPAPVTCTGAAAFSLGCLLPTTTDAQICPSQCLMLQPGESQQQAIDRFEKAAHCAIPQSTATQPGCVTFPQADRIDIDFIRKNEDSSYNGTLNSVAKVPHYKNGKAIGHSGATIGAGIDLGQMSLSQLQGFGNLSPAFIQLLTPYLKNNPRANPHAQGQAALTYLNAHPLVISQSDSQQLDILQNDVEQTTIEQVVQNYNAVAYTNFWYLPGGAQTAIIDLAFQYGTNLAAKTPQFWKEITTGQWQAAVDNLQNFGDSYPSRRKKEANKISNDITEEYLPKNEQECVK
jgi:hypothetical protein